MVLESWQQDIRALQAQGNKYIRKGAGCWTGAFVQYIEWWNANHSSWLLFTLLWLSSVCVNSIQIWWYCDKSKVTLITVDHHWYPNHRYYSYTLLIVTWFSDMAWTPILFPMAHGAVQMISDHHLAEYLIQRKVRRQTSDWRAAWRSELEKEVSPSHVGVSPVICRHTQSLFRYQSYKIGLQSPLEWKWRTSCTSEIL